MRRRPDEIAKMRRAGRVVAEMHARIRDALRPGVTTAELDLIGRRVIDQRGATSNFLGYGRPPFPAVICASPNEVVVHGIPSDSVVLQEGDLVSIDCGAVLEGYHADAAFTAGVGVLSEPDTRLCAVTERALWAGISAARSGSALNEIGRAVQALVEGEGMSVVREYVGHGIGTAMHEPPDVPNYWPGRPGPALQAGMPLAIEPMVILGGPDTKLASDGWTVVSADGTRAAHFEHTIVVTDDGAEVLTLP